jgi:hypothetical protein
MCDLSHGKEYSKYIREEQLLEFGVFRLNKKPRLSQAGFYAKFYGGILANQDDAVHDLLAGGVQVNPVGA